MDEDNLDGEDANFRKVNAYFRVAGCSAEEKLRLASSLNTTPEEFAILAKDPSSKIFERLIRNESLPGDIMFEMVAKKIRGHASLEVLENPNVTPEVLEYMLDVKYAGWESKPLLPRQAVLIVQNNNFPPERLSRMAYEGNLYEKIAAYGAPNLPIEIQKHIVDTETNATLLEKLAANPALQTELAVVLADTKNPNILTQLARNRKLAPAVAEKMFVLEGETLQNVLLMLARNLHLTDDIYRKIGELGDARVQDRLAINGKVPSDVKEAARVKGNPPWNPEDLLK